MKELDRGFFVVRISCLTYNHSKYIQDTLDSFVMQRTAFPFVCTIIDDASTDKTDVIIKQFLDSFFVLDDPAVSRNERKDFGQLVFAQHRENKNCFFAVILLNENHYQYRRSKTDYYKEWSDTKYTAICEGDDYWTDPYKLQKQVDYLESHPDCMLTVHSANWQTDDRIYPWGCQDAFPKDYSVEELIRCGGLFFATASFVFKSELGDDWPEWRRKAAVGDFPLQILSGLRGIVHYLPDNMCVYRYLHEGSWSSNQQSKTSNVAFQKNKIEWMTLLNDETEKKYQKAIYDQLFQHYNSLFSLREISFLDYARAVQKSGRKRYGRLMKDFLRMNLTPVYRFLNCFRKK